MTAAKGANDLQGIGSVEAAIQLLRGAGLAAFAAYYIGSLPFVLAFAAFWAAMTHLPQVQTALPAYAFILALLFVWMKAWQSRYCRLLLAQVEQRPPDPWDVRTFFRVCASQALVQATGWLVIPLALLCLVPAPWVYGLYQHCTVAESGDQRGTRALVKEAMGITRLWPRQQLLLQWLLSPLLLFLGVACYAGLLPVLQSHSVPLLEVTAAILTFVLILLLFPLSPLGVVTALNITGAIFAAGYLFGTLLGVHNLFTRAPGAAANVAFAVNVCGLAYLCLDPALKAGYVLRHFHARSRGTGEDLLLLLKQARAARATAALLLAAFLLAVPTAAAQDATPQAAPSLSPAQLDAALDTELQDPRYVWRELRQVDFEGNALVNAMRTLSDHISRTIERIISWGEDLLEWLFGGDSSGAGGGALVGAAQWYEMLRVLLIVLLIALLLVVAVLAVRAWRDRQPQEDLLSASPGPAPDVADDRTTADSLPEEGWLALAREYQEKGEYRLAARCLFLATLASLARQGLIQIARAKTNLDYRRELQRRAHAQPHLPQVFGNSVQIYERVWYGQHTPTEQGIEELMRNEKALVFREQD